MINNKTGYPIAWTIAASDSSAGAGIQADLATFSQFRVHGCTIITKITAQNTCGISSTYSLPSSVVQAQLQTLASDLAPKAIKISVLGDEAQLNFLVDFLANYAGHTVYDPVLASSSSNTPLTEMNLTSLITHKLLPLLTLITPNIQEAETLTNTKIKNADDILLAGQILLEYGVKNVLIKGGHFASEYASDLFINKQQFFWLNSKRQDIDIPVHGTGCHLSTVIAANLALEQNLSDAIIIGKRYINSAIRNAYLPYPKAIQYYIANFDFDWSYRDMPTLSSSPVLSSERFPACNNIGLYPVVDSSNWISQLAATGITTIQLRIKNADIKTLEDEIISSIQIARQYKIKLFINDYWQLAIKHKAYGVHLGQEDLVGIDVSDIRAAGLRLGISSHSYFELAIALNYHPTYIALGPIYPTSSKIMPWSAQGLERLAEWIKIVEPNCPLVAIGGINLDNIEDVLRAGARNIALISGITAASNPSATTLELLRIINNYA